MPSTTKAPAFASATQLSSADELMGKLAAYRPIETRDFDTKIGPSVATVCQVVLIGTDGQATDLGERPIFWQVVRRQLETATEQVPWLVGRLAQSGQAYRLESMTDDDEPAIRKALASLP